MQKGSDSSPLLGLHSSLSYGFLHRRQSLTLNSVRVLYGTHHVTPAIRAGSSPVKSLLFKAPNQLTGWNRSSHEFGRRASFSDRSDGADLLSSSAIASTNPNLEDCLTVIALPLPHKPLIPGFNMPIYVKDPKVLAALQERKKQEAPYAGVFLLKDDANSPSPSETDNVVEKFKGKGKPKKRRKELLKRIHKVGTLAQISSIQGEQVILTGHTRLQITEMISYWRSGLQYLSTNQKDYIVYEKVGEDPLTVTVNHLKDKPYDKDDSVIKATYSKVISTLRDVLKTNTLWRDQVQTYTQDIDDFSYQQLAEFGAGISGANKLQNQGFLEELDVHKRLELTLEYAETNKIHQEKDDESSLSEKIRKRIDSKKGKVPKHVLKVMEEELTKLKMLEGNWSDFDLTYNYLDWLTMLPWGNFSYENFDVLRAKKILDEDHYGLCDVKERILEFIAVGRLRGTSQGKIICLSGPPGVGKTSIGRSIARALDRKFFRFSVGGLSDVGEIKGHCQTYVGAMPGKMVQCLKSLGTENPLILIDEIDKLGVRCHDGDPASALLEVMDPKQNASFLDHYLNVTIDLSKVLFVCTANVIEMIPGPLLDRMEVIHLSGYITDEKMHIARDYLVKNTCRDCGIKPEQVYVSNAALLSLIENYCREAGVRNLQKHIEKIYRKVALELVRQGALSFDVTDSKDSKSSVQRRKLAGVMKILESSTGDLTESNTKQSGVVAKTFKKIVIDESNLADYVGNPVFQAEKIYEETPVGVVMGLAWTCMGGSTLYIETSFVEEGEGKGGLHITGQLGNVMKESAEIAHTVARRIMSEKEPENMFFANSKLHLHVPEGATPKDGPSAGCTMITSLLSLALKKPVRKDLAMTGEVTLTGRILPIGGVKEKTLAARRSQVKTIIFPEANRRDFAELEENVKDGFDVYFVDEYEQIFNIAFNYEH